MTDTDTIQGMTYPGWTQIACGCCHGLQWGGESPRECADCDGCGFLWRHNKTGLLAEYPGGPFRGREEAA